MESKKVAKKKFTLKKIKRIFINLLREIGNLFKGLFNKFMQLSVTIRAIICVWVVIVGLLIALVFFGSNNNNFKGTYSELENKMNEAAINYLNKSELYPLSTNKEKLDMQLLLDFSTLVESDIFDNTCVGYSVGYYDEDSDDYVVNSYLNCKKYTTEGYSKNK